MSSLGTVAIVISGRLAQFEMSSCEPGSVALHEKRSSGVKAGLNGAKQLLRRESWPLRHEIWAIAHETLIVWRERNGIPRESAPPDCGCSHTA
ncbi:hypothetical protein [Bacillus marinisedimentorum]|uniref:hypothetical protein n=1 Tax=Bacillus marinisedimentorum TaxID=1821260 RepID=UPI0014717BC7|nr:hypothetical protein [Bacillus marinisedimentorum]